MKKFHGSQRRHARKFRTYKQVEKETVAGPRDMSRVLVACTDGDIQETSKLPMSPLARKMREASAREAAF